MAQTSAFVHIRVLANFLLGYVDRDNENHPSEFGVKADTSAYFDHWRWAINSSVLHLNALRPGPQVRRKGKNRVIHVPSGVQHEVEHLSNEVTRLWRNFVSDPAMQPYEKLVEHLDDEARNGAARIRQRLVQILNIQEADILWRPPPK